MAVERSSLPLCVDLDGTLIRTDILAESILSLVKARPWYAFLLPFWLLKGKAGFKREVAGRVTVDAALLPYREELVAWLKSCRAAGRRLVLVTASDSILAQAVAKHLGLFDRVLASDGELNLKGAAKAEVLKREFPEGFEYAGDCRADLPVWGAARSAVLVEPEAGVEAEVRKTTTVGRVFGERRPRLALALKAMRPHQWAKNAVIFVPLITSRQIVDPAFLPGALLAFASFSLCASSVYILNDLMDLASDRRHPRKRERPFASGALPLSMGPALLLAPLAAGAALAFFLPPAFLLVLALYLGLTLWYSLRLKELLLLDVFCLAVLYTLRLLAGHAVTGIPLSAWLLAFSMFLFLSLALLKRVAELRTLAPDTPALPGRGYSRADLEPLARFGSTSAYLAVLVFALYIQSDQVARLYQRPAVLWLLCPVLMYSLTRVWVLAERGGVGDDPVLFALKDRSSYFALAAVAVLLVLAGR